MGQKTQNSDKDDDDPGRELPALARWPFGGVAAGALIIALAVVLAGGWLALSVLGLLNRASIRSTTGTVLDVVKLAFALVAGLGAVVGLVIAYRKQVFAEQAHEREAAREHRERTRLFNERFTSAAAQLGSEQAGVRLAGVYSMEGLADDWTTGRQKCIDVLCALARRGHAEEPEPDAPLAERLAWDDDRQLRHTIMRVVARHLKDGDVRSWRSHSFDFTGAIVDGGEWKDIRLTGGTITFAQARFIAGSLDFREANFSGGLLDFRHAMFAGGTLNLSGCVLNGGGIDFSDARFDGGRVDFGRSQTPGDIYIPATVVGEVFFCRSRFRGTYLDFSDSGLINALLDFRDSEIGAGTMKFDRTTMTAANLDFLRASFMGGVVDLSQATLNDPQPFTDRVPVGVLLPPNTGPAG
jgi:uncharacterized protein YjbI with pentapeptide repeats